MLIAAFAALVLVTPSQCSRVEYGESAIALTLSFAAEQDKALWTGKFRALDENFVSQHEQPLANALNQLETCLHEAIEYGLGLDEVAVMAFNAPVYKNDFDLEEFVKVAVGQGNHLILRSLLYFPIWKNDALRHWFLALSYKSTWCSVAEWNEHHEEVDWVANFCMTLKADNLAHYQFIKSDELLWAAISGRYKNINDMMVENDALNIIQTIELTDFQGIAQQVDCLIRNKAWKIIDFLQNIKIVLDFNQVKMDAAIKTAKGLEFLYSSGYPKKPSRLTLQQLLIEGKFAILDVFLKHIPNRMTEKNLNLVTMANSETMVPMLDWAFCRGLRESELSVYFHCAAANNCIRALDYLSSFGHYGLPDDVLLEAASKGNVNVLQWAFNKGERLNYQELLNAAVSSGQTNVIEWIPQKRPGLQPTVYALDRLCGLATDLELLQSFRIAHTLLPSKLGLLMAIRNGHLKTVQWILNMSKGPIDADCINLATEMGHSKVLNYLFQHGKFVCPSSASIHKAAGRGHLGVLKLLAPKLSLPMRQKILRIAIKTERRRVIKWVCKTPEICPKVDDYVTAAKLETLEIFRWLMQKYPAKVSHCLPIDYFLINGHVDNLNFIVACGYGHYMTKGNANTIAKNGHLPALQWLQKQTKELPTQEGLDGAIENGHLAVADWIFAQQRGLQVKLKSVNVAAIKGHLEVLKWAHSKGIVPHEHAISVASLEGHDGVEDWFYSPQSILRVEEKDWSDDEANNRQDLDSCILS